MLNNLKKTQNCSGSTLALLTMTHSKPCLNHLALQSIILCITVQGQILKKIISPAYIKHGPKRSLTPEHEFFLVLLQLRLGLLEDLGYRAGLSHTHFCVYPVWLSRKCIDETMPKCFQELFLNTCIIIDSTKILFEMSSSVRSQSVTYLSYKHHNTAKALSGITHAG